MKIDWKHVYKTTEMPMVIIMFLALIMCAMVSVHYASRSDHARFAYYQETKTHAISIDIHILDLETAIELADYLDDTMEKRTLITTLRDRLEVARQERIEIKAKLESFGEN